MTLKSNTKISLSELRAIIDQALLREEQMRGISDFAVREATRKFIEEIRTHIRRHVQITRASENDAADVLEKSESVLSELEENVNIVAEDALWDLLQSI